ncbi:MAG TPA: phytanoyl-CoA dioxygenase family protein [Caldimonas sp.]|jgi:hypothetical protein|nr:phytanoyl-CoA dioxygenase family protein [Caldimonas sp.]HEX2541585.1 phytanoyl-CoA dioxygenase family protein [Caldimonas sp.]
MAQPAATLLPSLLDRSLVARWTEAVERHYAAPGLRGSADFNVQSSSIRVSAVESVDVPGLLSTLFIGTLASLCKAELGESVACAVDASWVRRQYPIASYPPGHAAHCWHQDGALGFDFLAHAGDPFPDDALLPMVTCWIALSPCGDVAPGLELAGPPRRALLAVADLSEDRIAAMHSSAEFHRPVLAPGDALVFPGGLLHRTHVTPAMRRERTSIDLRFVAPARARRRLPGQRLLALH